MAGGIKLSEPAASGAFEDIQSARFKLGGLLRIDYDADGVPILTTAKERTETSLPYTLDPADCLVIVDAGASGDVDLMDIDDARGLAFMILREQSQAVTIDPDGSDTIQGGGSLSIPAQDDTITIYAPLTGTDWKVLSS